MKTAMQEWFDELKANYPYMANEIFDKGFNKYLQKEKEQFDDVFEEGFESAYQHFVNGKDFVKFEDYYNQTYNQNK